MPRPAGAPAALSPLTLRLWFGAVCCTGCAVALFAPAPPLSRPAWLLVALAVVAVADLAWVAHREHRGEPGWKFG